MPWHIMWPSIAGTNEQLLHTGTQSCHHPKQDYILDGIAESIRDATYCDRFYHMRSPYVCMYACIFMSVTLVHPAEAIGRNEVPFGRDTNVVQVTILDKGPGYPRRKGEPPVCSGAA